MPRRLDPNDRGRKHLPPPPPSDVQVPRGRRTPRGPKTGHHKEGGLRRVPQPAPVEATEPERVHFPHHNKLTDADYGIESQMGAKVQPMVEDRRRGVRLPAARRPADELGLEAALGRKAQTVDPRNGLGAANPGDKLYATPDTAPGFFKGGGVLPGSNWGVERKPRAGKTSLLGGTAIRSLVCSLWPHGALVPHLTPPCPARQREHDIKRRAEAQRTAYLRRKQGIALAAEREHVQQLEVRHAAAPSMPLPPQ